MRLRLVPSATALVLLLVPASARADFAHTVLPGESLSSIAAADGLSVADLAAANGLAADAQLIAGSTVMIPPQGTAAAAASPATPVSTSGPSAGAAGDGDADGDDAATATTTAVPGDGDADSDDVATTTTAAAGDGDADSDDGAPAAGVGSAPAQAPAVGASFSGTMTWFGGPDDPNAGGPPASGLGYRSDGMAFYNSGSLGGRWLLQFPWGQTLSMTQIDLGPAPSTGNTFDMAYSALPSTPYSEQTWPNPTVTGTYEGQ